MAAGPLSGAQQVPNYWWLPEVVAPGQSARRAVMPTTLPVWEGSRAIAEPRRSATLMLEAAMEPLALVESVRDEVGML